MKTTFCRLYLALVLGGCSPRVHTSPDASAPSRHDPNDAGSPDRDAAGPNNCESRPLRTFLVFERAGDQTMALGKRPQDKQTWTIAGRVLEHGVGFPAQDAPYDTTGSAQPGAKLSYLRIGGSDRDWTIVASDIPSFGVNDGSVVQASYSFQWGAFAPKLSSFRLLVGDELAFGYATGGTVSSFDVPDGWTVQEAAKLCEQPDRCGPWSNYSVKIAAVSGESRELAAGELAQLAGYAVASSSKQLRPSDRLCADWSVSESELLMTRSEPIGASGWLCNAMQSSTLPGVDIRFDANGPCQFTRAQARAGIQIPYSVVVTHDVAGVHSRALDLGHCTIPPPGDLSLFEELEGNGQFYALSDRGACGGESSDRAGTLHAGTFTHAFRWDGRNWRGPSDTGVPEGAEFPSGVYTLHVRSSGTFAADGGDDAGTAEPFALEGSLAILLTD